MSYADRVRSAPNLPAAMLALAEGIDELLAAPEPPTEAGWWPASNVAEWVPDAGGPDLAGIAARTRQAEQDLRTFEKEVFQAKRVQQDAKAIAACEAAIAAATDPEDVQALQARLTLLRDEGASIDINPTAGTRAHTTEEGDTAVVHLPTPSAEKQRIRRAWAKNVELANFLDHLTTPEVLDAYAKGGPTWLYSGNRDVVMQMPAYYRIAMIQDLEQDSPAAAQEMARDILKDAEAHGAMGTTLDGIVGGDD